MEMFVGTPVFGNVNVMRGMVAFISLLGSLCPHKGRCSLCRGSISMERGPNTLEKPQHLFGMQYPLVIYSAASFLVTIATNYPVGRVFNPN